MEKIYSQSRKSNMIRYKNYVNKNNKNNTFKDNIMMISFYYNQINIKIVNVRFEIRYTKQMITNFFIFLDSLY